MNVETAAIGDALAIGAVIDGAYVKWRVQLPDLPDVSAGIGEEILAGRMHVARLEGDVVGILNAQAGEDAFHVMNIAVHPDHEGKGIGRALMDHAEALARASGASRMVLATHQDMGDNVGLYQHLGWKVTAYEGVKVMMHRDIAPQ